MSLENDLRSIQLETTSRCNLRCATCLKPEYGQDWHERDIEPQLFARILSQISEIKTKPSVHLQGWGEPLLHADVYSHIKQLKALGATVSFTTNGSIMERRTADSLVDSGLDGLTFSMAGFSPATQDKFRGPGMLALVQNAIRTVVAAKDRHDTELPRLAVSYLLTEETIKELPDAVSWCGRHRVDMFATVHLTQVGCKTQQALQFIKSQPASRQYRLLRIRTHIKALLGGIQLKFKQFYPTLTPVCEKNPLNSLFISANGDVSPCVFLRPPVEGHLNWSYRDVICRHPPLSFGNIRNAPLAEIWDRSDYRAFRDKFQNRLEYHDTRLAGINYSLEGSHRLESATEAIRHYFAAHPPPEPCRLCAKIDGY